MLSYEKCKELKEAGYRVPGMRPGPRFWSGDGVHEPTLEELIEACGDDMLNLDQDNGWGCLVWCATNYEEYGDGDTPAEAVANLWLALNAKIGG
jgi:hypothetical protein